MQANDLHSIARKRIRIKTTDSNHNLPVAANVIDRNNFGTLGPNEKWVSDITFIPTHEGWLYLAIILDLYSKRSSGGPCAII